MKRFQKLGYFLLGAVMTGVITFAAPVLAQTIDAAFNSVNIEVDGKKTASAGESYTLDNGTKVPYSIVYEGTTYLPLRKIAELLGKDVVWNPQTNTAGVRDPAQVVEPTPYVDPTPSVEPTQKPDIPYDPPVSATANGDFFWVQGESRDPYHVARKYCIRSEKVDGADMVHTTFVLGVIGDAGIPCILTTEGIVRKSDGSLFCTIPGQTGENTVAFVSLEYFANTIIPLLEEECPNYRPPLSVTKDNYPMSYWNGQYGVYDTNIYKKLEDEGITSYYYRIDYKTGKADIVRRDDHRNIVIADIPIINNSYMTLDYYYSTFLPWIESIKK